MPETIRDKYQYFTRRTFPDYTQLATKRKITSLENAVADYVGNYLVSDKRLDPAIA